MLHWFFKFRCKCAVYNMQILTRYVHVLSCYKIIDAQDINKFWTRLDSLSFWKNRQVQLHIRGKIIICINVMIIYVIWRMKIWNLCQLITKPSSGDWTFARSMRITITSRDNGREESALWNSSWNMI